MARIAPFLLVLLLIGCGDDSTPAPQLREPDSGDEAGIRVPVRVVVTEDAVTVRPRRVAAFLPLRFRIANESGARARIRVAGEEPARIGDGDVAILDSPGRRPGRVSIRAGAGRAAVLIVRPGG